MSSKEFRIVVLTAPSGAGKSTIARRLLDVIPDLRFSVSATTRKPREHEVDGQHYFFLSEKTFRQYVREDKFLEYEEVYPGLFYGTLKEEVEKIGKQGAALLDIDVAGAMNVKSIYGDSALVTFIQPPSLEILEERLRRRGTETEDRLHNRLGKAEKEMAFATAADVVIVNDDLETAVAETISYVSTFLSS